jgi:hypothetical protein
LALYLERHVKPHRADDATRMTLVALSSFVDWRHPLTVVRPQTLIRVASTGIPVVVVLEDGIRGPS